MIRLLFLLTFLPLRIFAQTKTGYSNINFDNSYALCELTLLPDTIVIVENSSQIGPNQNFTRLEKLKSKHYMLWYMEIARGGIVDPTIYKDDLKVKTKRDMLKLTFGGRQKYYTVNKQITGLGFCYELIRIRKD